MLTWTEVWTLRGQALASAVMSHCAWGDAPSSPEFEASATALLKDRSLIMEIIESINAEWTRFTKDNGYPSVAKLDWKAIRIEGDEEVETLADDEHEGWMRAALLLQGELETWNRLDQ
jgi:hypothetical protein